LDPADGENDGACGREKEGVEEAVCRVQPRHAAADLSQTVNLAHLRFQLVILGRLCVDQVLLLENKQDSPAEDLVFPAKERDVAANPDSQYAARHPDRGEKEQRRKNSRGERDRRTRPRAPPTRAARKSITTRAF